MALAAVFDLDMEQLDAMNAFCNSNIDELVYMREAPGFESLDGDFMLHLEKALYGLHHSPLLWYREISNTLIRLGFTPIDEEPCLFTNGWVFMFFYVDDIVLLAQKGDRSYLKATKACLMELYEMRDLGELHWFLGLQTLRDRPQRQIWIGQDTYIDKITWRFNLESHPKAWTPLSTTAMELKVNTEQAKPETQLLYQQKIGSLIYPAVITHPDIAASMSLLASHIQNPSSIHMAEADWIIAYLHDTQALAIEFNSQEEHYIQWSEADKPDEVLQAASNTLYNDDLDTRWSTEGYLIQLYGGPIDWWAGKQRTVTMSTTEAELVSLSNTAKELVWWQHLFKKMSFNPDHEIVLHCDNTQTTGLMQKENPAFTTKLHHIDVSQHWLRECVQSGLSHIQWVPTNEMLVDGLTKPLLRQKHERFIKILGLCDISEQLHLLTSNTSNEPPDWKTQEGREGKDGKRLRHKSVWFLDSDL